MRERGWASAALPAPPNPSIAWIQPDTRTPPAPPDPSTARVQPEAWARTRLAWARIQLAWARTQLAWAWIRLACTRLKPEPHERLADWPARCVRQLGDVVFAGEDAEAAWHAWNVEPRYAGLGRLYRDQRFDALVACPRCHRISTVAGRTVCQQCSAADRLVRA